MIQSGEEQNGIQRPGISMEGTKRKEHKREKGREEGMEKKPGKTRRKSKCRAGSGRRLCIAGTGIVVIGGISALGLLEILSLTQTGGLLFLAICGCVFVYK